MTNFERIFTESQILLTEGAIIERLKVEFDADIDKYVNHAGLIYSNPKILETLYKQYIDVGQKNNIPIMLMTPTRKVNYESIVKTKHLNMNIIADSCFFLNEIKNSFGEYSKSILIGGLLGCKGDACSSKNALGTMQSYEFHKTQVASFKNEDIDFLYAGIMPEIYEAIGMAQAMSELAL